VCGILTIHFQSQCSCYSVLLIEHIAELFEEFVAVNIVIGSPSGHLPAEIVGSNPYGGTDVCLL
jgi:hypothetical protein